jgi:tetratricopeptide (TPR) repeat protein
MALAATIFAVVLAISRRFVFWGMCVSVALGLFLAVRNIPKLSKACFLVSGSIIAIAALFSGRDALALWLTRELHKSGDYDRGLARIKRLGFGIPSPFILEIEGMFLSMAGEKAAAESCFQRALAKTEHRSRQRAGILLRLGFLTDNLGRTEDARHYFQTVVQLGDTSGSARMGLASLLLDHDGEPQKALDLIEQTEAEATLRWSMKARALAKLGRRQEANEAIAQTLKGVDPSSRPLSAGIYYEVGLALLDLKENASAIQHFRTASEYDPHGHTGSLARKKIEALAGPAKEKAAGAFGNAPAAPI